MRDAMKNLGSDSNKINPRVCIFQLVSALMYKLCKPLSVKMMNINLKSPSLLPQTFHSVSTLHIKTTSPKSLLIFLIYCQSRISGCNSSDTEEQKQIEINYASPELQTGEMQNIVEAGGGEIKAIEEQTGGSSKTDEERFGSSSRNWSREDCHDSGML